MASLLSKLSAKKMRNKVIIGIGAASAISGAKEGEGVVKNATSSAVEMGMASLMSPGLYLLSKYGKGAAESTVKAYESMNRKARQNSMGGTEMPFSSNTFVDNKQIYTMRQASMAMIQQSKQIANEAIYGNEAAHMHR